MKYYEMLKELERYPSGYGYESGRGFLPSTYTRNSEGDFKVTWIVESLKGNKGSLLNFYWNRKDTRENLKKDTYRVVSSYEELFDVFIECAKDKHNHYHNSTVAGWLKKAVKKHIVSEETAEKLLARYITEAAGGSNED